MKSFRPALPLAIVLLFMRVGPLEADQVTLRGGIIREGVTDKDGTLLTIFDPLKRTIVRDTKVEKVESAATRKFEEFRVDQPLVVHGGKMPTYVIGVQSTPWDELGRRSFRYIGPGSSKPVQMTQAINGLGPKTVHIRGIDGFWRGLVATSQVPKSTVLALLARVPQDNQQERLKVGQLLIQAEWYPEALMELDRLQRDFPDLTETIATVRNMVRQLVAQERLDEVTIRRKALQPLAVQAILKDFPTGGVSPEILQEVREQVLRDEARRDADRRLARRVREAADALPADVRNALREPIHTMLSDLDEAPDAVRDRFTPFLERDAVETNEVRVYSPPHVVARSSPTDELANRDVEATIAHGGEVEANQPDVPSTAGSSVAEAQFAQALSGWVAGPDRAVTDLDSAISLWDTRTLIQQYLAGRTESDRNQALSALRSITLAGTDGQSRVPLQPDLIAVIVQNAPPFVRSAADEQPDSTRRLRALDDENPEPTEYALRLPPEYHPLRSYPTLVVLHGGEGPEATIEPWVEEAARRGYIVIAPEYNVPGKPKDYRYTTSEHAAVELSIRDARRRFAIDSDRVYLVGSVLGGTMAWDFGLAHPDLFAGAVIISGLPAKYVWAYRDHAKHLPMYLVLGDLAPTEPDLILPFGTSLISKNYDVIYTEYFHRGLEPLPEEIPDVFDWLDSRRREPYPKEFDVRSARESDARFFGAVIREHASGRIVAPEQADPLGKNLDPAKLTVSLRSTANLVDVTTSGIGALDLWLGPPHIDPTRRVEIRLNGRSVFRGDPPIDIAPILEDLRVRGDRRQVYWMRYTAKVPGARR